MRCVESQSWKGPWRAPHSTWSMIREKSLSQLLYWGPAQQRAWSPSSGCPNRGKQLSAGGSHASRPYLTFPTAHLSLLGTSAPSSCQPCSVGQQSGPLKCPPYRLKHALVLQSFLTHHGFHTKWDAPSPSFSSSQSGHSTAAFGP